MSSRPVRSSLFGTCLLSLLAGVALFTVLIASWATSVPERARRQFGEPSARLSLAQRYILAATLLWKSQALQQPLDPAAESVTFKVALGESTNAIIGRLWEQRLIADPGAFRAYLQYAGLDTSIQAGDYQLSAAMSAIEIAQAIQDATPAQITFVILDGWRIEEIAASLPTSGLSFSAEAFLSAASVHPADIGFITEIPAQASLEGFLFPGAYQVPREITAPDLIHLALERFQENLSSELRSGFVNQGLSLYQAVILASIIEREAVVEEEMPMIASVFYNRLAAGMNLASDPTVQYAVGYNDLQSTWWTNPLRADHLKIDSPYNTYLYPGLPPSPIANPGLNALRATAFPAQTPYYYFRALCDGSNRHAFAETYEEHLRNACP